MDGYKNLHWDLQCSIFRIQLAITWPTDVTDCPVIFLNVHDLMKKDTNSPPNKPLRKICLLLIKYLFHEDPAFKSSIICNEKEIIGKGPTLHEKRSNITWLRSVFRWLCHWHVICLDNRPIQKKKYYWLTKSRNMMLRGSFPRSKNKFWLARIEMSQNMNFNG